MERLRKPFQGVKNIIRFNWHFYLLAAFGVALLFLLDYFLPIPYSGIALTVCILLLASTTISLLVSLYVYDLSGLYELRWMDDFSITENGTIASINAGFDETSVLLRQKFPRAELLAFDFYNPATHTEVSIQRARRAYPAFPGTKEISTVRLPVEDHSFDGIFLILAAHEIRSEEERTVFFRELRRALSDNGTIVVTEHLRDLPNFLAYNIGFFHFIPRSSWIRTFKNAKLKIAGEKKITPFITTFILEKDDPQS